MYGRALIALDLHYWRYVNCSILPFFNKNEEILKNLKILNVNISTVVQCQPK